MTGAGRRLLGPPPSWRAAALVFLASLLLAVGASIAYTARAVQRSDQQWCELLRGIDQPLPSGTPATERTRRFVAEVHKLRVGKGC